MHIFVEIYKMLIVFYYKWINYYYKSVRSKFDRNVRKLSAISILLALIPSKEAVKMIEMPYMRLKLGYTDLKYI